MSKEICLREIVRLLNTSNCAIMGCLEGGHPSVKEYPLCVVKSACLPSSTRLRSEMTIALTLWKSLVPYLIAHYHMSQHLFLFSTYFQASSTNKLACSFQTFSAACRSNYQHRRHIKAFHFRRLRNYICCRSLIGTRPLLCLACYFEQSIPVWFLRLILTLNLVPHFSKQS